MGFSTGLQYVPGTYAETGEIVALARAAARRGGVYATHMRNEGTALEEAVGETINIAEQAQCPLEISHLKVDAPSRWGASAKALAIDRRGPGARAARQRRSVSLRRRQLEPRHPLSVVGARGRSGPKIARAAE